MIHLRHLLASCLLVLGLASCAKHDHDHDHAKPAGGHAHAAPHGGVLVEIGDHAYNLEFVRDPAAGRLTAYVLDGHAENFIRIKTPAIAVTVGTGADARPLSLQAVANSATGETVGDTSQFEAQADWLKATSPITLSITSLEIRGSAFGKVSATVPAPSP